MKKILNLLTLFVLFLSTFAPNVAADEVYNYKITSANFDVSNSIIILTSPDTIDKPITNEIKLIKLDNPQRAYFDIDSAVLTVPKQDWTFNYPGIKQVKINQFSTNPNVVRVVMYYDNDFDISKVKFERINNNIIIKLKELKLDSTYFQNIYRDEHSSSSDFYENLTITSPSPEPTKPNDNLVEQIQDAFNTTVQLAAQQIEPESLFIKKELTLNSKYFLNKITPKPNAVLISGFGALTIEKPMILQNPSRLVYDIPNAVVNKNIRNSEYKINETDTVKIGQFEANKARIVVYTEDVTKYIPIYSSDNQSILISNYEKVDPQSLISNHTEITSYYYEKIDNHTSSMIFSFNKPMIMGLDRINSRLILYLYNTTKFDNNQFNAKYNNTPFDKTNVTPLMPLGLKVEVPLEKDTLVDAYTGSDGKTLKIKIKNTKKEKTAIISNPTTGKASHSIVIDPGHGGADCGAIRGDITEKAIVLDISKRVNQLLKEKGYNVAMTRTDDSTVSLQERVDFSEARNPDIFISIHVNSSVKPEITGIETHYWRQESLTLAQTIHASMASNIQSKDRGLFKSKFYVINHTTAPAILVEIGFISNENEKSQLVSDKRKQDTAKAIVEGVENYFKQHQ